MHALNRKVNGTLLRMVVGDRGAANNTTVCGLLAMAMGECQTVLQSSRYATSGLAQEPTVRQPLPTPPPYMRTDKVIDAPYKIQPKRVFAVVDVGGTQYKVTPDDVVVTEKLSGLDINDIIRLERVLLLGSPSETIIGRPYIPGACVTAAVEEQFLDGKVIIFHKRRRKNSRRTKGHRQPLTTLRILEIEGMQNEGEGDEEEPSPLLPDSNS